jgi:hypothetical protein
LSPKATVKGMMHTYWTSVPFEVLNRNQACRFWSHQLIKIMQMGMLNAAVLTISLQSNSCQSNENLAQNQKTASLGRTVLIINVFSRLGATLLLTIENLITKELLPTKGKPNCIKIIFVCMYTIFTWINTTSGVCPMPLRTL